MRELERRNRMSTQLELIGTVPVPPGVHLTRRLRTALEHIAARQPVTNDELGARLHEFKLGHDDPEIARWGHPRNDRCRFCADDGRGAGAALRAKGLAKWKRGAGWTLVGYRATTSGSQDTGYDPSTAAFPEGF